MLSLAVSSTSTLHAASVEHSPIRVSPAEQASKDSSPDVINVMETSSCAETMFSDVPTPSSSEMADALAKAMENPVDLWPEDPYPTFGSEFDSEDGAANEPKTSVFSSESEAEQPSINSESEADTDEEAAVAISASSRLVKPREKCDARYRNVLTGAVHIGLKGSTEFVYCSRYRSINFALLPEEAVIEQRFKCKDCYGLRGVQAVDAEASRQPDHLPMG